jgi:hypothetical protein
MLPILPCRSIDEQAQFYLALGFSESYRQSRPNPYLEVRRGGIVLQFYGLRAHEPGSRFDTCFALLDEDVDVDALHATFRAGLKAAYGRVPTRGLPRLGALGTVADDVRQFLVTDPAGNQIRIGRPVPTRPEPTGRAGRALATATRLAESKEDPDAAARVLDPVLDEIEAAGGPTAVRALVLRAGIALAHDDRPLVAELVGRARVVPLTVAERAVAGAELDRAQDLLGTTDEIPGDPGSDEEEER